MRRYAQLKRGQIDEIEAYQAQGFHCLGLRGHRWDDELSNARVRHPVPVIKTGSTGKVGRGHSRQTLRGHGSLRPSVDNL